MLLVQLADSCRVFQLGANGRVVNEIKVVDSLCCFVQPLAVSIRKIQPIVSVNTELQVRRVWMSHIPVMFVGQICWFFAQTNIDGCRVLPLFASAKGETACFNAASSLFNHACQVLRGDEQVAEAQVAVLAKAAYGLLDDRQHRSLVCEA